MAGRSTHGTRGGARIALVAALLLGACREPVAEREARAQRAHVDSVVAAGGRVDSATALPELLRRFREHAGANPDTLRHALASRDALVKAWVAALARRDTAALVAMALDRAEFAWLFYPESDLSKPPYETPPGLLWSQLAANGSDGLRAALDRFGGSTIELRSLRCPEPGPGGALRLHQGCLVRLRVGRDTFPEARLFGSIVEREGRFKFLSHASKL